VIAGNLIAFAACVPFALPPSGDGTDWTLVLYLGVVQIALAYLMLTSAVRTVAAFEVSLLLLVEPALNPVWSWLFLGETPGAATIAGGVLILGATAVKVWADARRGTETAVEEAARAAPP
jgi:drug/metabolite transporter (DMT)-like permease